MNNYIIHLENGDETFQFTLFKKWHIKYTLNGKTNQINLRAPLPVIVKNGVVDPSNMFRRIGLLTPLI